MANPAAPTEAGTAKTGFGIYLNGAADEPAWPRIVDAAVVADETTKSGALIVTPQASATAGGLSTFNASGSDGADTGLLVATAVAVKASAGQLYGYHIYNPNDEVCFVNLYNIAQGSVTVGTSNVKTEIPVPAGAAAPLALPFGITFSTAITVSATKTSGSTTAPDVGLTVQLFYK